MPRAEALDQILQLRVYSKGTNMIAKLLQGKLIGEFRTDLRTIWDSPGKSLIKLPYTSDSNTVIYTIRPHGAE